MLTSALPARLIKPSFSVKRDKESFLYLNKPRFEESHIVPSLSNAISTILLPGGIFNFFVIFSTSPFTVLAIPFNKCVLHKDPSSANSKLTV